MIRRLAIFMLLVLALTACETTTPIPVQESLGVVFPSGVSAELDAHIQASTRQHLNDGGSDYFLLQFSAPLAQDTRAILEAADVVFYDYMPNYAHYVYLPAEVLDILEQLAKKGILRHVGPIPAEAKLEARLGEKIRADSDLHFDVVIHFFEALSPSAQAELETLVEVREYAFGPVNLAEGTVTASDVEVILALPFVKWMEERVLMELGD